MDFIRSSDTHSAKDNATDYVADHIHSDSARRWSTSKQERQLLGPEDDFSVGTDAHSFFMSEAQGKSQRHSSKSEGYHYEPSSKAARGSEMEGDSGSEVSLKRKLSHLGRAESYESNISDLSDLSRISHDVSSLLNAMTADPEDVLTNLGFAEPDLRTRIPDRFLESPSSAHGIDVDYFRMSLDQDDAYGTPSQLSPAWSDSGLSRLPLRFIASPSDPTNMVVSAGYGSVPLISEPLEEVPEDSFDLMKHLRLNKPQHYTKGMFLEPVAEELEVSSVGSGTVHTKLSRKLSNEGTIVREESLERGNEGTDVIIDIPSGTNGVVNDVYSSEVLEKENCEKPGHSRINADAELEHASDLTSTTDTHFSENAEVMASKSLEDAVCSNNTYEEKQQFDDSSLSDVNKNYLSQDLVGENQHENPEFNPASFLPAHLKVASIEIQDSFELEEIGTEDSNDRDFLCVTDQETALIVKSSEKRLARENSGESSGFEEMLPDKETNSPSPSSPALHARKFSERAQIVEDERRPLLALLDPDVLSSRLEASPRATFAQRRTRSLTKQRPVCEETFASCGASASLLGPQFPAGQEESLGMSVSHVDATVAYGVPDGESSFTVRSGNHGFNLLDSGAEYQVDETRSLNLGSHRESGISDLPAGGSEKHLQKESEHSGTAADLIVETVAVRISNPSSILEGNNNTSLEPPKCSVLLNSEITGEYNEESSQLSSLADPFTAEQSTVEGKETHLKSADISLSSLENHGNEPGLHVESTHLEEGGPHFRDISFPKNRLETSLPPDDEKLVGACAGSSEEQASRKALQKVDSEYHQHYLHEINVLQESIQKYETNLSVTEPLDSVKAPSYTKKILVRLTEEVSAIQELRVLINSELERMKSLLEERRSMLLAGVPRDALSPGVSQRMADLLREQSSLRVGLSDISDELLIRRKASRRARLHAYIDDAKKELREEKERCSQEFREEIKEAVSRELSEKFSSEMELLRRDVRSKDAVIEQLKMKVERDERS